MNKIPSFKVNHLVLRRGIYVSRVDHTPSGDTITTFDIRMTEPNRQPALHPETLHTIEHLAATWLRNHPVWGPRTIYWGPMGCCTGNYLVLSGDWKPADIAPVMEEMMRWIGNFKGDVPGATPRDCGNYSYMDLDDARRQAMRYADEVLHEISPESMVYPE